MTNEEIENRLGQLIKDERGFTCEILHLIREADARKLYLERSFSNIYEWLVRRYGYSHTAAHRRIQTARLMNAIPELEESLKVGAMSLSNAARLQSVMRREERRTKIKISTDRKKNLFNELLGKTESEAEAILSEAFPESAAMKAHVRSLNELESRLSLVLEKEALEALKRVQELLSHILPGANMAEIVSYLAEDYIERKDPLEKKSGPDKRRVNLREEVIRRAEGRCEFSDPVSGQICGSRHQIEVDHRLPKALGGSDDLKNLRCLCRAHNQYEAERILGEAFMERKRKQRAAKTSTPHPS